MKSFEETAEEVISKMQSKEENKNHGSQVLPMVALRGKVLFPKTVLNFDVGRPMSVKSIDVASQGNSLLFISAQKNAFIDAPRTGDIANTGVVVRIKQIIKLANGNMKLSVEALYRAKIMEFKQTNDYFLVEVMEVPYFRDAIDVEIEAYLRQAQRSFLEYSLSDKRITKEMVMTITAVGDANEFVDNAMSVLPFKQKDVQAILDIDFTKERLIAFDNLVCRENEIMKIEQTISSKVKESIDKGQKEYYLREQIKAIHSELGDDTNEREELSQELKDKNLPEVVLEKALKEISRLDKLNPSSPDYSVLLNYLDWIKELPFNTYTEDTENISDAKLVLDADHFGLEKVKERIVEYLSVLKLTKEIKGPILCFVGPPGVGKTSVATSIARAMGRKFVRMSLGGVKDEAEIRGHRKTYIGAMPGRIIYGLKNAGSSNPVFLLDEIDKLSSDIHGDPASALLEVLDPEQNATFRDRFLEVPYDLSKVMFITTANSLDTIPYPLLDRMEVIELSGYTDVEKLQIAKRYLIPKAIKQNGVPENKIEFTDDAIKEIIESYTLEAGVRNLEREIGSVVRKIASLFAENIKARKQVVTKEKVEKLLGAKKHLRDMTLTKDEVGACTGLAWTSVGGTTLTVEVTTMSGRGEIFLTGKLGDVMKESAKTALSFIRSKAKEYKIAEDVFEKTDLHIHVPEGATPKDGPSAGITIATAILSALTKKPVKKSIAMTGEITLLGRVLAIGGLKEKALAAYRQGITEIIIPKDNKRNLQDIPKEVLDKLTFIPVSNVKEVFKRAIIW